MGTSSTTSSGLSVENSSAAAVIHSCLIVPDPNCWNAMRIVFGSRLLPEHAVRLANGTSAAAPR